jgi:hypothetical protein
MQAFQVLMNQKIAVGDYDIDALPVSFDVTQSPLKESLENFKKLIGPNITQVQHFFNSEFAKMSPNLYAPLTVKNPSLSGDFDPGCFSYGDSSLDGSGLSYGNDGLTKHCRINFRTQNASSSTQNVATENVFFRVKGNADMIRVQKTKSTMCHKQDNSMGNFRAYDQYLDVRPVEYEHLLRDYADLRDYLVTQNNTKDTLYSDDMRYAFAKLQLEVSEKTYATYDRAMKETVMDTFFVPKASGKCSDATPSSKTTNGYCMPEGRPYGWVREVKPEGSNFRYDLYVPGITHLVPKDTPDSCALVTFTFTPYRTVYGSAGAVACTKGSNPDGSVTAAVDGPSLGVSCKGWKFVQGKPRTYQTEFRSPLVLSFSEKPGLTTLNQLQDVRFDLDADGKQESVGWVAGTAGAFLALDRNGNGNIDDGSELFGQGTSAIQMGTQNTARTLQGYEALAQYDQDHNGVIDEKDPVYSELLLWFDYNADGQSQPLELMTLAAKGVTSVETSFNDVAKAAQFQNGNLIRYEGRFHGPSFCPAQGCWSYDVFFGATTELSHAGMP